MYAYLQSEHPEALKAYLSSRETRRIWIPAALGYGENPVRGRPGGMLVFDIELLRILD